MALLKKIRSATLIESLVATVLVVIVFIVASLVLNNLLLNSFSRNTHVVESRIFELEYGRQHNTIILPYNEEFGNWKIELKMEQTESKNILISRAVNKNNGKEIIKSRLCEIRN